MRWDWDATLGLWMRSQRGSTHESTDGQASTNNVVVLVVPYGTSPYGGPESQTVGSGRAVVYSQRQEGRGHLDPRDRRRPVDVASADGQPILLAPGRTWVELVDSDNQLADG